MKKLKKLEQLEFDLVSPWLGGNAESRQIEQLSQSFSKLSEEKKRLASLAHRLHHEDLLGPLFAKPTNELAELKVQWLLLDFGRRGNALDAAKESLLAANLGFNRKHQEIIFRVQRAFLGLTSSRGKIAVAQSAVDSARAGERSHTAATSTLSKFASATKCSRAIAPQPMTTPINFFIQVRSIARSNYAIV
jgi:hypothetical protein